MGDTAIVKVSQGDLRGKKVRGHNGVSYYSFQGIPYGKAPIGSLRFKAPEDAEPWTGVRDAMSLGSVCPQMNVYNVKLNENEDCLFTNVYTPEINPESALPVMVWIHGGGLLWGSGNTDIYGPDYLLPHQVILVTFNYRLGALGFLDVRGADSTSNNGVRDQILALKWVKKNIKSFGGDPENVTIFGESAGGLSVHCLVLSPLSKGLFHKAIIMSGSMFGPLGSLQHDPEKAFRYAKGLGFSGTTAQDLVDFLRTVQPSDLVAKSLLTLKEYMGIVIDDSSGGDAVLPGDPAHLYQNLLFNNVPLMVGVTSGEGKLAYLVDPSSTINYSFFNENLESLLPFALKLKKGSEKSEEITKRIKKFYFGDEPISEKKRDEFIDLYGDSRITYGIHRLSQKHVQVSDTPLYYYQFSFESKFNFLMMRGKDIPGKGAGHGDELFYLFYGDKSNNYHKPGTPEHKVSSNITKLWTNFAKTGNPNNGIDVHWNPVTKEKKTYLNIDSEVSTHTDLNQRRMKFWDQIYEECGVL